MPTNLPAPLTSFVGRDREIADVCRLLRGTRLLTLTGAGGCGKSRLAAEVARRILAEYPDGIWLVEFAALTDAELIPGAVASVLGVTEQPHRPTVAMLADYLRPKSLLLVLDNCEHLLPLAELADGLLRAAPGLRLLATSRAGLGVPGETVWRVPSMSVPAPDRSPLRDRLEEYEATRLFVERAASVRPDFAVTDGNAPAIVQVCRRLDGIPLAIELAAARVGALTVEQIAARLDDRFGLLTGGSRTGLPRHRTLRAAMDWSYDLLPERERTVLNRLSVFAGGWTLEAAEAVCGGGGGGVEPPAVLDALTSLVDKSLVNVEMMGDAARFRLLETVRQYARDRLDESAETDTVRIRHGDFFLAAAEAAESSPPGPQETASLDRWEIEHDNFRAALQWNASQAGGVEKALRLAGALGDFWDLRNHYTEGRAWLRQLLAAGHGAAPPVRIKALKAAAGLAKHQGNVVEFARLARELLALSEAENDTWAAGWAYHYMMHVADDEGDYVRAAGFLDRGIALAGKIGDALGLTSLLTCGGDHERARGRYERAAALLEEALRLCRLNGTRRSTIAPLHNLGYAVLRLGDRVRAATLFREALTLAREMNITRHIICCIAAVAGAQADESPEHAARLFGAVEALSGAAGLHMMAVDQADVDRNVAAVRERLGRDRFETLAAAGANLTMEQAAEAALSGDTVAGESVARRSAAGRNGLTPREREVAGLIAEGLSNREIAARLVIAERTAEGHVQSIFNKLGFKSRAQIAAWVVEQKVGTTPA